MTVATIALSNVYLQQKADNCSNVLIRIIHHFLQCISIERRNLSHRISYINNEIHCLIFIFEGTKVVFYYNKGAIFYLTFYKDSAMTIFKTFTFTKNKKSYFKIHYKTKQFL